MTLTATQRRRQRRQRNRAAATTSSTESMAKISDGTSLSSNDKTSESTGCDSHETTCCTCCSDEGHGGSGSKSTPHSGEDPGLDMMVAKLSLSDNSVDVISSDTRIDLLPGVQNDVLPVIETPANGASEVAKFPIEATIEDYMNMKGDDFNRIWKRSLRFLKKASENFEKPAPSCRDRSSRCNLTFHTKVYDDIRTNPVIWFDFFLSNQRDYNAHNQSPNFETAEQAIIVLSTLADSKPWSGAGSTGNREEVNDILRWAQKFLLRLQALTETYGDDRQKYRTSTVTHTLMKQVLNFYSPRGISANSISEEAVIAFRMCAELELKDHGEFGGEVLGWIPGRQRMTFGKLREMPDDKIWKWIVRHVRTSGSRRW